MRTEPTTDGLITALRTAGVERGASIGLALNPGIGAGLATDGGEWAVTEGDANAVIAAIEQELRPRWVWWTAVETAAPLIAAGITVGTSWDLAAVHRLLFGGFRADPSRVWAALHDRPLAGIPRMGQLDLLADQGDEGADGGDPVRPDHYLRPEWASGGWARDAHRMARWAATALAAARMQRERLSTVPAGGDPLAIAHSESAAELLCVELSATGLPIDRAVALELIEAAAGPRADTATAAAEIRSERDRAVLQHAPRAVDLRNPAQVKEMLTALGFDLPDTRSWRLEPFRGTHPAIDALLEWRKAERIATTYGHSWLDRQVGADGRLRGAWTGSDGAAGRMTAQAGLHNLPAELRPAVAAEPGHVFVRADLGQIEPRILALVSGDAALARASLDDDLYAPVAARLRVERPVAKVAVLAAMYGQTSGAAGAALRGLESAYPVAMRYLTTAYEAGRAGQDVRTHGGRLVRMGRLPPDLDEDGERAAIAARGRFARNAVIQGAAAEFFKMWAVTVRARAAASGARIVLCLHDELLVHAPAAQAAEVADVVRAALQETARRWQPDGAAVRFVADLSTVTRWSDAKG